MFYQIIQTPENPKPSQPCSGSIPATPCPLLSMHLCFKAKDNVGSRAEELLVLEMISGLVNRGQVIRGLTVFYQSMIVELYKP
jgi:hypothetical protein